VTPESPLATVLRLLTGTTAGPGGCMLWAGATSKKRRGQRRPSCRHGGRTRNPAHVILEAVAGPRPPAHHCGHACPGGEMELCVAPAHLEWQAPIDNQRRKRGKFKPKGAGA
jgi:hypothetical protein